MSTETTGSFGSVCQSCFIHAGILPLEDSIGKDYEAHVHPVEAEQGSVIGIALEHFMLLIELSDELGAALRALVDPGKGKRLIEGVERVSLDGPHPEIVIKAIS